jgi:D-3-phosphoglycerate dehydrogenase
LARFPETLYDVFPAAEAKGRQAHTILLRSHKLQEEEVDIAVRAIARCGAGTNNVPVARMTELGIPVFNTPGANANSVKELVLCGLLLGSRRVIDGINHMKELGKEGKARERVEKDKARFGGREIKGKTLAVIGLGHIGGATARDASALGMDVVGYDPALSVSTALKLPKDIQVADSISSAVSNADYIRYVIYRLFGRVG